MRKVRKLIRDRAPDSIRGVMRLCLACRGNGFDMVRMADGRHVRMNCPTCKGSGRVRW